MSAAVMPMRRTVSAPARPGNMATDTVANIDAANAARQFNDFAILKSTSQISNWPG
jgi:hypothetical protein